MQENPGSEFANSLAALRERIIDRAMAPLQVAVVAICVFLNMVDGMDVVVLSFAAPVIAAEWGLPAVSIRSPALRRPR